MFVILAPHSFHLVDSSGQIRQIRQVRPDGDDGQR